MSERPTTTPLDSLLLLAAASHFRGPKIKTFLQKVIFCAEEKALEQKVGFPRFHFYRWDHGPFSKELAEEAKHLANSGLLWSDDDGPTPRGQDALKDLREIVKDHPKASKALELVDQFAERFARMPLEDVLTKVYRMDVRLGFGTVKVGDVKPRRDLIQPEEIQVEPEDQGLFDLIAWRLSQTTEEARSEENARRLSDDEADEFWKRVYA